MTEIERKALALVNEVLEHRELPIKMQMCPLSNACDAALIRAIEQHEAFKQEVSDAVEYFMDGPVDLETARERLGRFIIRKLDPLVEALWEAFPISFAEVPMCPGDSDKFHAALAARGLKIVEDKS